MKKKIFPNMWFKKFIHIIVIGSLVGYFIRSYYQKWDVFINIIFSLVLFLITLVSWGFLGYMKSKEKNNE